MHVNQVIIPDGLRGTLKPNLNIAVSDLEKTVRQYVEDSTVLTKRNADDAYPSMRYKGFHVYLDYHDETVTVTDVRE